MTGPAAGDAASGPLLLIPGSRGRCRRIGDFELVAAPFSEPPFPVQATLLEEDTWRVLSAPSRLSPVEESMVRVMTDLIDQRPLSPGRVLSHGRRWEAIVIDLEQEPICREAWVRQAIEQGLQEAARRGLHALALPLLGSRHGGLAGSRSLEILLEALHQTPGRFKKASRALRGQGARSAAGFESRPTGGAGNLKIWLQVPAGELGPVNEQLTTALPTPRG